MGYKVQTITLVAILGFALLLSAATTTHNAYASTEIISIRSGDGPFFGSDSSITMLVGPQDTGFNVPLSAAQFAAAGSGPSAIVVPNHPAWKPHLTVDPAANYISTHAIHPNQFGPNNSLATALYAADFEVTSTSVDSATLDIHLLSDNNLGDTANEGVFINGIPVPSTKDVSGASFGADRIFINRDITSMVHPGTNTLYVLGTDIGGPSGVQFHADITIESTANAVGGQDLAVTNYFASTTSILLGDGTGNFDPRVPYPSGGGSAFVAVGDYNEDGIEDLAVANNIFGSNKIAILIGNGDGTFNPPILVSSMFSAGVIAVADYNGDTHQDLGVTTSGAGLTVNFGDGTGNFSGANSIATGPGGTLYVVTGDFNKDGNADLATIKQHVNANNIAIVLGDGTGSFSTPTIKSTGAFDPRGLATADLNGDGSLDLVTANTGTSNVSVLLGDGAGSFGAATVFPVGAEPYHVAVADFNGDGSLDLVTPNRNHGNFTILLGDGTGSFGTPNIFTNSGGSNFVVVGDFNKDGNADIATNAGGKASVFLGNGDGTFGTETLHDAGPVPTGLAVGNFDGPSAPADTTPPVVTGTPDRAPDSNGWYNHAVTVTWTGTDDGGIASCDPATVYAGPDGSSIALMGHCTDNAGNVGEGTVTINYDATAPTITGAPTTASNANNWYNTDVTVHFTASDGTSGIATVTPDRTLTTEAAGQSVTGTATDNAGNSASFTVSDINIDKTVPVITTTQAPQPNANSWNNQDVTVDFSAADSLSGLDGASTSTTTFTAEGAGQTASATFTDLAGNSASASATVNIDKTAPEAYNQFDPVTKDVLVYGVDGASGVQTGAIAPFSVTQVKWGGDDDDDDNDDNGKAQLRTYIITDNAGNTLVLTEKVKAEGKQIKVEVVSLQYNGGDVITPDKVKKSFEWSTNKNGTIKELEQKMTIGKGSDKQTVDAKFEGKKAQTTIKEGHGGDDDDDEDDDDGKKNKVVLQGMVLLKMTTNNGSLMIEY